MMSGSKSRRNEILKTASIYAVLFIVTSMSSAALWAPDVAAITCSGSPSYNWRAARGHNDANYYMYGTKAYTKITDLTICGTTDKTSVGGDLVWVIEPDLQMVETGFYKGNYSSKGLESMNAPHYFWGRRNAANTTWDYSDISTGSGYYPSLGDWVYFSVYGNIDSSNRDWHVNITKPGSYTIIINGLTVTYSYGTVSEVVMEIHNIESPSVSANFTNIQSAYNTGGVLTWYGWTTSHDIDNAPYYSKQVSSSASKYCMNSESNTAVCP